MNFLIWIRFVIDYGRSAALYKKICFEGIIACWEMWYNWFWMQLWMFFLNAILNIFEIWSVLFGLFFWFYNAECLSVYNCILKVFSSDGFLLFIYIICCRCPRLSPRTCYVSCSSPTPFYSCFVQLALQAQTDTKHERQCAPHDGSLATVYGDSREQLHCVYMEISEMAYFKI